MKKILLGVVALVVVALAVTLVVKAGDSTKESKKAKTEVVTDASECGEVKTCCSETCCSETCCSEMGEKPACDEAKKASGCCSDSKDKSHNHTGCASKCGSADKVAAKDHSKCNH